MDVYHKVVVSDGGALSVERAMRTQDEKPRGLLHRIDARIEVKADLSAGAARTLRLTKGAALGLENRILSAGDVVKKTAVNPTLSAVGMSAANSIYRAGMENSGVEAAEKAVTGASSLVRSYSKWRKDTRKYKRDKKAWRLERQGDKLKAKLEKTRIKYEGEVTDKVVFSKRKPKPKRPKPKKPDSLLVTNGLNAIKNEALMRMQNSDDSSTQAIAKGLEFARRNPFSGKLSKQSKAEKRFQKKTLKWEKSNNHLQFKESKRGAAGKSDSQKAARKKQTQKKAAQKKRQTQKIQKAQRAVAKAKNELAKEVAKKVVFSKVKTVVIGVGLVIVMIFILPMMLKKKGITTIEEERIAAFPIYFISCPKSIRIKCLMNMRCIILY
ncbi:MAG: hypothetical protein NC452_19320 [Eubacterium sp.]|nr:hypothetical protein [Eubacterium sp.]